MISISLIQLYLKKTAEQNPTHLVLSLYVILSNHNQVELWLLLLPSSLLLIIEKLESQ